MVCRNGFTLTVLIAPYLMLSVVDIIMFCISLAAHNFLGIDVQGVMCVGHLVMASGLPGSLYVGSIIVGLCYGAQWSLMPAITSEIFGLRHFGTLFNTIGVASPIGAYFMSVRIAGYLYDIEAKKEHGGHIWATGLEGLSGSSHSDALLCHGAHCFRLTFIILACVCVLGCGICLWLLGRTRLFYLQLHERLHGCQT